MSRITSSSYPAVTDSQDGDLFAIVRNGQLMKMNRAALVELIQTLAANIQKSATTTELIDIYSTINGQGKFHGLQVFNTTNDTPVYASGPAPQDPWVDATGTTVITPV